MKTFTLVVLCLAVFLPCIRGLDGCRCRFPPYVKGTLFQLSDSMLPPFPTFTWSMSFQDHLSTMTPMNGENTTYIADIAAGLTFELSGTKCTAGSADIVPSHFTNGCLPDFAEEESDTVFKFTEHGLVHRLVVESIGENPSICTPAFISASIPLDQGPELYVYIVAGITEDSHKDKEFYTRGLTQCDGMTVSQAAVSTFLDRCDIGNH